MNEETGQPAEAAPEDAGQEENVQTQEGEAQERGSVWPEDWRERAARSYSGQKDGDSYGKELKRLQRLNSPEELYRSYRHLEIKGQKGDPAFPEKGTDEEKAAWRKEHNIPVEGYRVDDLDLGGIEVGDEDAELIQSYLDYAHQHNIPQDKVSATIQWQFQDIERRAQERAQKDQQDQLAARDELRDEFGNKMNSYLGAVYGLLDQVSEETKENILGARLADGTALGNHAPTLRWLISLASAANPAATVVPNTGAGTMANIDAEIADIEKLMQTDRKAYFSDEAKQNRYQELLEAKERLEARR